MPLNIDDILADIQRDDRDGIEEAFRALIGWPKEAVIVGTTPAQRRDVFADICESLIASENTRIMPASTFQAILDEAEDMDGGTYQDGARAALRCSRVLARLDREAS